MHVLSKGAALLAAGLLALSSGCGPAGLVITMYPENNSGQSGTATFTPRGSKLEVELEVSAGADVGEQPAHIHSGRCGEIGPVAPSFNGSKVGGALNPVKNGRSVTVLDGVSLSDLSGGRYAVNVHYSKDGALYVSCGNIP